MIPAGGLIPPCVLLIPVSVCGQPDTSYLPRPHRLSDNTTKFCILPTKTHPLKMWVRQEATNYSMQQSENPLYLRNIALLVLRIVLE